jgi:hypothetical protein
LPVVLLAVLLGVNTRLPAAPLPDSAKTPAINALVYVGLGKKDPDNAKRIDPALHELRTRSSEAIHDPKAKALPIVQEKGKKVGSIERDKWAESDTRVATLEGTAVMRVWFTDGTPEEQVSSSTPSPALASKRGATSRTALSWNCQYTRRGLRRSKRPPGRG